MIHHLAVRFHISIGLCLVLLFFFSISCQREKLALPKDYAITCCAATFGKGIYKTNNGGISWFPISVEQQDIHAYYKQIYQDPLQKDTLYIATTGAGLFTLDLKTETFAPIEQFDHDNVRSIAFLDSQPNPSTYEMWIGINDKGVYHSSEPLKDWKIENKGLYYHSINILFSRNGLLFVGTENDLFKWDKPANQWTISSQGIRNKNIYSMDSDLGGKVLFAGSGKYGEEKGFLEKIPCLYKSIDQGKTWVPSDKGLPEETLIYEITINTNHPERIYLGTSDGIYRSINSGENWQKMVEGLPKDLKVFDIKIAGMSDGNDVVYAAGSKGVFMTEDSDQTLWINKNFGLEPTAITGIVLISDNQGSKLKAKS
ncbi:MAG: hypothetical protein JW932_01195 [Deltaproteobacteria bacterium]|nr:hypothetical protein [Deltaproteobacteria bacterium]